MTVGLLRHYIVRPLTARFQGHWESKSQSCPTESVVQWRTRSARWVAVTVVVSRHAGPSPIEAGLAVIRGVSRVP